METVDIFIKNANELITLKGPNRPRVKSEMNDLSIIDNGSIAVKDGKIVEVGKNLKFKAKKTIDATGKIVMPGFVDPHTHLVFGGSREFELDWKLRGCGYIDIKKKGGGISYTVEKTRKLSFEELYGQAKKRLDKMLVYGTTSCEAKSGYGLDVETEIKILDINKKLDENHLIGIVSTFLGAHAIPSEMKTDEYVDIIIDEMLPKTKGKAVFCDVFCEEGFFSYSQSKEILLAGKKHGLTPKIHADEIKDTNGAKLAAEVDAISAEHLLMSNIDGLKKMAEKNILGVLLPGTPFSLMIKEYANARKMIDLGVPVAIATDLNPNCWTENMQYMIQLSCFNMKMTPAEAIVASTFNSACAINQQKNVGSLEVGKQADILILDCPNHMFIPYNFGINHVKNVIKNGELII